MQLNNCLGCNRPFTPVWIEELELFSKVCHHCFEDGVEQAEERRFERIARENEY